MSSTSSWRDAFRSSIFSDFSSLDSLDLRTAAISFLLLDLASLILLFSISISDCKSAMRASASSIVSCCSLTASRSTSWTGAGSGAGSGVDSGSISPPVSSSCCNSSCSSACSASGIAPSASSSSTMTAGFGLVEGSGAVLAIAVIVPSTANGAKRSPDILNASSWFSASISTVET